MKVVAGVEVKKPTGHIIIITVVEFTKCLLQLFAVHLDGARCVVRIIQHIMCARVVGLCVLIIFCNRHERYRIKSSDELKIETRARAEPALCWRQLSQ